MIIVQAIKGRGGDYETGMRPAVAQIRLVVGPGELPVIKRRQGPRISGRRLIRTVDLTLIRGAL